MIKTPTVLVLGAGSSAHFGYPLGNSLIAGLSRDLKKPAKDEILLGKWNAQQLEEFRVRLSRSGHYSIDAFLEDNEEQLELGRYLIARQLKECEDPDGLFPPRDSGWYQYLFNKLISGGPDRIGENAISIITFNYDRSLECYLHEALTHRFRISPSEAAKHLAPLRIIHIHGILGKYPDVPYRTEASPEELYEISRGIKIIHELKAASSGFCSTEFESAHACLQRAERIFFLGFGFHPDNVRRFNFFTPKALKGKEVIASLSGVASITRKELMERLTPLGFPESLIELWPCNSFFESVAPLN